MDDILKSVEIEEQAVSAIRQLIELTQIGGFNLAKFQSNTKDVIGFLPAHNVRQ